VHNAEGAATNRQRLEVLKEQQELIDEEREQALDGSPHPEGTTAPRDVNNIDDKEEHVEAAPEKTLEGDGENADEGAEADAAEPKLEGESNAEKLAALKAEDEAIKSENAEQDKVADSTEKPIP